MEDDDDMDEILALLDKLQNVATKIAQLDRLASLMGFFGLQDDLVEEMPSIPFLQTNEPNEEPSNRNVMIIEWEN